MGWGYGSLANPLISRFHGAVSKKDFFATGFVSLALGVAKIEEECRWNTRSGKTF